MLSVGLQIFKTLISKCVLFLPFSGGAVGWPSDFENFDLILPFFLGGTVGGPSDFQKNNLKMNSFSFLFQVVLSEILVGLRNKLQQTLLLPLDYAEARDMVVQICLFYQPNLFVYYYTVTSKFLLGESFENANIKTF